MGLLFRIKLQDEHMYTIIPVTPAPANPYYDEVREKETLSYTSYDIRYPQFNNADPEFNKKIADVVATGKDEFTEFAIDNWKAYRETSFEDGDPGEFPPEPYPFYVKWEPARVDDSYISFVMRIGGYNGGAHGYENIVSFNYDVIGQKEATLADLFPNDTEYLKTVSEFSRATLLPELIKAGELDTLSADESVAAIDNLKAMLYAGTEPTPENFSVFTFTDTDITLYFSQYQVAPYVYGEQQVTMPR